MVHRRGLVFRRTCGAVVIAVCASVPTAGAQPRYDVHIDSISIHPQTIYKNLPAGFPDPVLTLLTIKDENNRYVHGLADTSRWLAENDSTPSGRRVGDIWNSLLEYHRDETTFPPDPNLKHTLPNYMVTEAMDVTANGVSVALVLDYSTSMWEQTPIMEDGIRQFIREMSRFDRASIIKFYKLVEVKQTFTTDTLLLMNGIATPTDSRYGTAFYDALYQAIDLTRHEKGRIAVAAFTDGIDNFSTKQPDEVIAFAKSVNIPLFVIGLGNQLEENVLRRLADETGGSYSHADHASELADIYRTIYSLIRGYYVLAHTSPDPFANGTWRHVDVTLTEGGRTGRGQGDYYVPYIPPNIRTSITARTDSFVVRNQDTVRVAMAGDTVRFEINAASTGRFMAQQVVIRHVPPDSVSILEFDSPPDSVSGDTLIWRFSQIPIGENRQMGYNGVIFSPLPPAGIEVVTFAKSSCPYDSLASDDADALTLRALGTPDLIVRIDPVDSTVSPGHPLILSGTVWNQGTGPITNPFEVRMDAAGTQIVLNTLQSLGVGDSARITSSWTPMSGSTRIRLFADPLNRILEFDESNNTDSMNVDAGVTALELVVNRVSLSDTVRYVAAGFPSQVFSNVFALDQNGLPIYGLADTLKWLRSAQIYKGHRISDTWKLLEYHAPDTTQPASPDATPSLRVIERRRVSTKVVYVLDYSGSMSPWKSPVETEWKNRFDSGDLAAVAGASSGAELVQAMTDNSTRLVTAFRRPAVGSLRRLVDAVELAVNTAPGKPVVVIASGEDNGSASVYQSVIDLALKQGSPVFALTTIPVTDSLKILCEETGGLFLGFSTKESLSDGFERLNRILRNYYVLAHASPDTFQNAIRRDVDVTLNAFGRTARDVGTYTPASKGVNLAIAKAVAGDSLSIVGEDTLFYIHTGDTAVWRIRISNTGHEDAGVFQVKDVLPVGLSFAASDPPISHIQGDTIRWEISSLAVRSNLDIVYRTLADTLEGPAITALVNRADLISNQDISAPDNTASDTLWYVPIRYPDVAVSKRGAGLHDPNRTTGIRSSVSAGDTLVYAVRVNNNGLKTALNVLVQDDLPKYCKLISFSGFAFVKDSFPYHDVKPLSDPIVVPGGDRYQWTIDKLDPSQFTDFELRCRVDTLLPPEPTMLVNTVMAECVEDTSQGNNAASDTLWAEAFLPPGPAVTATPGDIAPGDSVRIQVQTPVPVKSWDIAVLFDDHSQITDYADSFISATTLAPETWTPVMPFFADTRMRTPGTKEPVAVIFTTTDLYDVVSVDTAYFSISRADLLVNKIVSADSFAATGIDTLWMSQPGQTVRYTINVRNTGQRSLDYIHVVDRLPEGMIWGSSEPAPVSTTDDSIVWQIPALAPNVSYPIALYMVLDTLTVASGSAMRNIASAYGTHNDLLIDDADTATFSYVPLVPPDAAVSKRVTGDSLVVSGGDSTWYSPHGDTVTYELSVVNLGQLPCRNITVTDVLPPQLHPLDFTLSPIRTSNDSLVWIIDNLPERGGRITWSYRCRLDTLLPPEPTMLVNTVMAECVEDTSQGNNTASDTLWAEAFLPPGPAVTATPGDIAPGDSVRIQVRTPVPVKSWDIAVLFDDHSQITDYADSFISATTLAPETWTPVMPFFADTRMRTPGTKEPVAVIFTTTDLYDVVSVDTAYFSISRADLLVNKIVSADSFAATGIDTLWMSQPGQTVRYTINVRNTGQRSLDHIHVVDRLPEGMIWGSSEPAPVSTTDDSIVWQIPALEPNGSYPIALSVILDTLTIASGSAMMNTVYAYGNHNDLVIEDADTATFSYVPLVPPDAAISKRVTGDSLAVSGGDSTWYSPPGDTVTYELSVVNLGQLPCRNITMTDVLPPQLHPLDFTFLPIKTSNDSLVWIIDNLPERGGRRTWSYRCVMDTDMPSFDVQLINAVRTVSLDDAVSTNNADADTLVSNGITPPPPEITAAPTQIHPGDSVLFSVRSPIDISTWSLIVVRADGSRVDPFADDYTHGHTLAPGVWTQDIPVFTDTWMRMNGKNECAAVIVETIDRWGLPQSDTAWFDISADDAFFLDENVFRPGEGPLGMRVELTSNRDATVIIYDISGALVRHAYQGPLRAGWNELTWDGRNDRGDLMGSGLYVAICSSGELKVARKFILVR